MPVFAGNLLTTDPGGPYNFSMLNTQTTEVRGRFCKSTDRNQLNEADCCNIEPGQSQQCVTEYYVCAAAIAFKKDLTDMDIIHFLTNVE